jgi:hypothetical protein
MARKRNWAGVVQGKLTIVEEFGRDEHGNVLWRCLCGCGQECIKSNNNLNAGVKSCSTSCGVAESNAARARHGMWKSKEYMCWQQMKARCYNENNTHYQRYGGRGITVHQPWVDSFEAFLADVGLAPDTPRASLDRIDCDGNYEPCNVRWATPKQQSNNRGITLKTPFRGEEMPLADIARLVGIPYYQVFGRYQRGLRGEELVTRQKIGRKPKVK